MLSRCSTAMRARRAYHIQQDVLEWISAQRGPIQYIRAQRYQQEKGFVAYAKDFVQFFRADTKSGAATSPEEAVVSAADTTSTGTPSATPKDRLASAMDQYYESEELIKKMKWKRVTWDNDADYAAFARRIMDNESMFRRVPAFSFMSVHVVHDPLITDAVALPPVERTIQEADLTRWVLEERECRAPAPYTKQSSRERRSAFAVDWSSGEVRILDSSSAQEVLTFLTEIAPRLQAVQVRMEQQQTAQKESVEHARVRVGAVIKFNEHEASFWDDPARKTSPAYVNPDEVEQFLSSLLRSAFLYRRFLKGQQLRIIPSGQPYRSDVDKLELCIPANFGDYNWLHAHATFERLERTLNTFRRYWWFWFSLGIVIVGDLDIL